MQELLESPTLPASTEAHLRKLVQEFGTAPLRNGKEMRDLVQSDREGFRIAAIAVLRENQEVRGCRYLVTLLWTHELLVATLIDPTIPKPLSVSVAQTAAKVDPQLHIRLSRYLVEGALEKQDLPEDAASRLLEILSTITDSGGLAPLLRQILLHPNPRIRSRVTLLVGKGQAGVRVLEKLLGDEDSRVRANAIEALWHNGDSQVPGIFRNALADSNNRVIGNAIFGLHTIGDFYAVKAALELLKHPNVVFRATAVWVMGRTRDPRFLPFLGRLLCESRGQLRKSVFSAVESIKKAFHGRDRSSIGIFCVTPPSIPANSPQLRLAIVSSSSGEALDILPTGIVVSVGTEQITELQISEEKNDRVSVGFVLPAPSSEIDPQISEAPIRAVLKRKRRTEYWSIARYAKPREEGYVPQRLFGQELSAAKQETRKEVASPFTTNDFALRSTIDGKRTRAEELPAIKDAIAGILNGTVPSLGTRHLVVVAGADAFRNGEDVTHVIAAARTNQFTVHAVCTAPSEQLQQICKETGGMLRVAPDASSVLLELQILYSALTRRFLLDFEMPAAPSPADSITVQAYSKTGFGELTIPLSPPAKPD